MLEQTTGSHSEVLRFYDPFTEIADLAESGVTETTVRSVTIPLSELIPPPLLKELQQRLPRLEQDLLVEMTIFPSSAKLDFDIHPGFTTFIESVARGEDIVNASNGGVSGSKIHDLLLNHDFPTRLEELKFFLEQHPELAGDTWLFQVGGFPFNDGSAFFRWPSGPFVTQDIAIANNIEGFKQQKLVGLGVTTEGQIKFVELEIDSSSQQRLEESLQQVHELSIFIGTPGLIVRDSHASDLSSILDNFNGDPRHIWDMIFAGMGLTGPDGYATPSGSPLVQHFQNLIRTGRKNEILSALNSGQPMRISLTSLQDKDRNLLKSMFLTESGRAELARLSVVPMINDEEYTFEELLKSNEIDVISGIALPISLGVYNHIVWGITKSGNLAMLRTSGLLDGAISSKSGVTMEGLSLLCEKAGFKYAMLGSQGRDVPQVLKNGVIQPLAGDDSISQELLLKMLNKPATTPAIVVTVPAASI